MLRPCKTKSLAAAWPHMTTSCAMLCSALHHVMLLNALPMPWHAMPFPAVFALLVGSSIPNLAIPGGPIDNCN